MQSPRIDKQVCVNQPFSTCHIVADVNHTITTNKKCITHLEKKMECSTN